MGEHLGQERIIESHAVGPEVQGIQTTVEALFPVERIGVAPRPHYYLVVQIQSQGGPHHANGNVIVCISVNIMVKV